MLIQWPCWTCSLVPSICQILERFESITTYPTKGLWPESFFKMTWHKVTCLYLTSICLLYFSVLHWLNTFHIVTNFIKLYNPFFLNNIKCYFTMMKIHKVTSIYHKARVPSKASSNKPKLQQSLWSVVKQFNNLSSPYCSAFLQHALASVPANCLIDPKWNTELINKVLMRVCCSITCHLNQPAQVLQAIYFLSYAAHSAVCLSFW